MIIFCNIIGVKCFNFLGLSPMASSLLSIRAHGWIWWPRCMSHHALRISRNNKDRIVHMWKIFLLAVTFFAFFQFSNVHKIKARACTDFSFTYDVYFGPIELYSKAEVDMSNSLRENVFFVTQVGRHKKYTLFTPLFSR